MEEDSQNTATRTTRRSTRSSAKVNKVPPAMPIEARAPLKRTKAWIANTTGVAAVNGSKETKNASGDTSPTNKKRLLEKDKVMDGGGDDDDDDMDVDPEENLRMQKLEDMGLSLDSPHASQQPEVFACSVQMTGPFEDNSVTPSVLLEHSQSVQNEDLGVLRNKAVEPSRSKRVASAKSAHQLGSQEDRPQIPMAKSRSIADYQQTMANARGTDVPKSTQYVPNSAVSYKIRQRVNNVPRRTQPVPPKNQGAKKPAVKLSVKEIHGSSPRGCCWYLTRLVCLLLLSAVVLLAYKEAPALQNLTSDGENPTKKVKPGEFSAKWSDLQSQFPGQRLELWKRSRIHLEKHLQTARPTEPVSLILAAGRGAERTLYCLAQGLASAFSAAHNASVLHIDGAATAGQDSDRVKMDIDSKLQGAFGGGDRPAAVIHRLEELPPGSTLIFYRYCDHENAAYKQVFLAFTVLLPQEHLDSQHSLKEVEEIVQDYIAERFVGSGSWPAFDRMDADKLSGLWSRISHLVLPVAAESQVELSGC